MCQVPHATNPSYKHNPARTDTLHYRSHIAVVAMVRLIIFAPLLPFVALDSFVVGHLRQWARQAASTCTMLASTLFNMLRLIITRRSGAPSAVRRCRHPSGVLHRPPTQACFRCLQTDAAPVKVCCSGGGIFFFWQLGALRWLQRAGRLHDAHFVGYSAGALTATMAACDVSLQRAVDAAYALTIKYHIWERPMGLVGVWGGCVAGTSHDIYSTSAFNIHSTHV